MNVLLTSLSGADSAANRQFAAAENARLKETKTAFFRENSKDHITTSIAKDSQHPGDRDAEKEIIYKLTIIP